MYSDNRLKNPSAESGNTEHWGSVFNVSVVEGGVEGSYCFLFGSTASMLQALSVPGQPEDHKVVGHFLPENDVDGDNVDVHAWIEITYEYGDGTLDIVRVPFRDDLHGY